MEEEGKIKVINSNEAEIYVKIAEDVVKFRAKIVESARIKLLINKETMQKMTKVQMLRVNEQCFKYELKRNKEKMKIYNNRIVLNHSNKTIRNVNRQFPEVTLKLNNSVANEETNNNKNLNENDKICINTHSKHKSAKSVVKNCKSTTIERLKHKRNSLINSEEKCQKSVKI